MNAKIKAEEFFDMMSFCRKNLEEIPKECLQGETGVLAYLNFMQDKISPSKLSENINVSLPRIATVLNSLESKNLIKKRTDVNDKRKTIVEITEKGKSAILLKKEKAINSIAKVLENLSEDEIDDYIRLTKKIVGIIDNIHNKKENQI